DARACVGADSARRCPQHDLVAFGQGDGQTIRARERHCAFGDQLKHFIENELLVLFKLRPLRLRDRSACIKTGVPRGQSFSTANLLVQRREGQQRLQRVALRWFRGIFLTIIENGGGGSV